MALYPRAIPKLIPAGSNDPQIQVVGVVLHVDAGNAQSLEHLFQNDGGIESHLFVRKDGSSEQYRDSAFEADAQYLGNSWVEGGVRKGYLSVETQGYGPGEWTPAQLATIKDILLWAHKVHGVPLKPCTGPKAPGVGYHCQFKDWNPNNHSCPGPDRIKQFGSELVPWLAQQSVTYPLPDVRALLRRKRRAAKDPATRSWLDGLLATIRRGPKRK